MLCGMQPMRHLLHRASVARMSAHYCRLIIAEYFPKDISHDHAE
jgi:hypothetical protein